MNWSCLAFSCLFPSILPCFTLTEQEHPRRHLPSFRSKPTQCEADNECLLNGKLPSPLPSCPCLEVSFFCLSPLGSLSTSCLPRAAWPALGCSARPIRPPIFGDDWTADAASLVLTDLLCPWKPPSNYPTSPLVRLPTSHLNSTNRVSSPKPSQES